MKLCEILFHTATWFNDLRQNVHSQYSRIDKSTRTILCAQFNSFEMPATKKTLNPDLDRERRRCTFDVEELARYWYGGQNKLDEKRARGMLTN